MEEQYGLPGDHYRQLAAAAQPMFPVMHHRIMTSTCPSPAGPHQFPLASGGGLVDGSALMGYGLGGAGHASFHDQTGEVSGGPHHVWNGIVGNTDMNYGEASNNSRWPRQETLTLLEIRSRLNSRFKDTNQKAPLWDEVSRIMAEEHGYQRSGKKCKEKFENLYKYYKKTKEGKAGRQDGKHYRFFRQLEAIYGDQSINVQSSSTLMDTQYPVRSNSLLYDHQCSNMNRPSNAINHESLSFSINSTEFETSSSENNNNDDDLSAIAFKTKNERSKMKGKGSSASWKAKVEHFVDLQMKKVIATQESWMEKIVKSMVEREEEKLEREDERRRNDAARFDREVSEFWTKEKAWIEARDAALIGALRKLRGNDHMQLELPSFPERMIGRDRISNDARVDYSASCYNRWSEEEISSLIELRNGLEPSAYVGAIWDDIASKMACSGFMRSASECKEKWESVSVYFTMTSEVKKKRKEDYYKTSGYYLDPKPEKHHHHHHQSGNALGLDNSPSSSNVATQMHQNNFFHLLFGEGENLWEKYGTLRLGKDKNIDPE